MLLAKRAKLKDTYLVEYYQCLDFMNNSYSFLTGYLVGAYPGAVRP